MRVYLAAFTRRGGLLGQRLLEGLRDAGIECLGYGVLEKSAPPLLPMSGTLAEFAAKAFREADGIVFIGACGIAVRAVAPLLQDKTRDPAVVVMDEAGRFSVSLLSGHIGGANRLAELAAEITGAVPVITTATDVRGVFAVDSWAAAQGLAILNPEEIKTVSGALLDGKAVGILSDFSVEGGLPPGFLLPEEWGHSPPPVGVSITLDGVKAPFPHTLRLTPPIVTLGIGCRRGATLEQIEEQVSNLLSSSVLRETGRIRSGPVSFSALKQVCSIDLKQHEEGLLAFCEKHRLKARFFDAPALDRVKGEFTASAFVKEVTGVDNVCERAALAGCGTGGRLLVPKTAGNGVTCALALDHWRVLFGY